MRDDTAVGLWLGDHKRAWDRPAVAYAFHAGFVQAGIVRLNAGDVDFPGAAIGGASEKQSFMPVSEGYALS